MYICYISFYGLLSNIIFLFLDVLRSLSDDRGSPVTPESYVPRHHGRGPAQLAAPSTHPDDRQLTILRADRQY